MGFRCSGLAAAGGLALLGSNALAVDLYNALLGGTPQSQGWLYYRTLATGTETVTPSATNYNSSATNLELGGFSNDYTDGTHVNPNFPELNAANGFAVRLELQVLSESHTGNDRAGISLIVLDSQGKGIELGFWTDHIFAQSGADFTHAEDAAYDTTSAAHIPYYLIVKDDTYTLADGGLQTILSGPLRDYSGRAIPPYTLSNYLFLGDDTTEAGGSFAVDYVGILPEPTCLGSLGGGLLLLRRRRRD